MRVTCLLLRLFVAQAAFTGLWPGQRYHRASRPAVHPRLAIPRPASTPQTPPCIVTIGEKRYNLTDWASRHPGGEAVLLGFASGDRNATQAFLRAGHSHAAHAMLARFEVLEGGSSAGTGSGGEATDAGVAGPLESQGVGLRGKLFTREDPLQLHKLLGSFVLLHYAYRYALALTIDPTGGRSETRTLSCTPSRHAGARR